jgi:hypothetical protein
VGKLLWLYHATEIQTTYYFYTWLSTIRPIVISEVKSKAVSQHTYGGAGGEKV